MVIVLIPGRVSQALAGMPLAEMGGGVAGVIQQVDQALLSGRDSPVGAGAKHPVQAKMSWVAPGQQRYPSRAAHR